jgi:protoporphyrinogen oxidase
MDDTVVIIGAGPAGLGAAYELTQQGVKPLVLEKADKVGGIARTENYKDYYFDIGGHRFFTKSERIEKLWHKMLGKDFIRVSRLSRIYYNGRFFNYPLDFYNTLSNLGVIESLLIVLSYLKAQIVPHPKEETFEQWVSNRFGERLYRTFFQTYTEKVWGIPCHTIRADWAAQRIKGLSLLVAVSNALLGTQNARSLIDEFDYPLYGPGMMWERFKEAIEAEGGRVLLNTDILSLKHKNGLIVSALSVKDSKTAELPVGHLVSSIPINKLVAMLDPTPPDAVLAAARKLSYRAFIIVVLIIDKKDLFPDQWIYVHSPDVKVGRIQNFKNWSSSMVPDPEKTTVGMEYFCNEDDEVWTMKDEELADTASRELSYLGLSQGHDVVDSCVVRQPYAYPIYDHEYKERLKTIWDYLGTIDNLQSIGRNGMHRYNNMDHSMQTGMLAAENILGSRHDLWNEDEGQEYFEEDRKTNARQRVSQEFLTRTFARIDKLAFATAVGSVSGLLVFLATVWLVIIGDQVVGPILELLSNYFFGYTVTIQGALIAFGCSFFWGFLFAWLLAYLRNFFLGLYLYRLKKKSELLSLKDFFDYL